MGFCFNIDIWSENKEFTQMLYVVLPTFLLFINITCKSESFIVNLLNITPIRVILRVQHNINRRAICHERREQPSCKKYLELWKKNHTNSQMI